MNVSTANRNRLLGCLAVLSGQLDPADLEPLLRASDRDSTRSFLALLREHTRLDHHALELLQTLTESLARVPGPAGDPSALREWLHDALLCSAATPAELASEATDDPTVRPTVEDRRPEYSPRFIIPDRSKFRRGGIGCVYLGRDTQFNRDVAIKELQLRFADDPTHRAKLEHEARITASLLHPGVPPVFGRGQYANGRPYYAMQYLHGRTYKEAIDQFHENGTEASSEAETSKQFQELLDHFVAASRTIGFAHNEKIAHLDLKPSNILINDPGETWVTDWGLAHELENGRVSWQLSDPGLVAGTPGFMSPEVARNDLAKIGRASDIFSLGATLYYLLTGHSPYRGVTRTEVLDQARAGRVTWPRLAHSCIPPDLSDICMKAMSEEPGNRYDCCSTLVRAILEVNRSSQEQLTRLASVDPATLGAVVAQLRSTTTFALPALLTTWTDLRGKDHPGAEGHRRRVALALLALVNQGREEYLGYLEMQLVSEIDIRQPEAILELLLIREGLGRYAFPEEREALARRIFEQADWSSASFEGQERHFQALVGSIGLSRWEDYWEGERALQNGAFVVDFLFRVDPYQRPYLSRLSLPHWASALEPVKQWLLRPLLAIFLDKDRPSHVWSVAFELLHGYSDPTADNLGDLMARAPIQRGILWWNNFLPVLGDTPSLQRLLADPYWPTVEQGADSFEYRSRSRAFVAGALLARGEFDLVRPLLRSDAEPTLRNYLIHMPVLCDFDLPPFLEWLSSETEAHVRSALLLAIGEYQHHEALLRALTLPSFRGLIGELYCHHADPGVHSAVEWLLRQCDVAFPPLPRSAQKAAVSALGRQRWFVNTIGQSFAVIDSSDHSPSSVNRSRKPRRIGMSMCPVTIGEFRRFLEESGQAEQSNGPRGDADEPVTEVSWFEAASFCNWLSAREGIPVEQYCYCPTIGPDRSQVMRIQRGWRDLSGYRLATEAEWDYACRGGREMRCPWGDTEELLDRYAWYQTNSGNRIHPVGRLKPNLFGFFDMLGNVWEWCQDEFAEREAWQSEVGEFVDDEQDRVLRGGSALHRGADLCCTLRDGARPNIRRLDIGFRIVCNLPLWEGEQ